MGRVRAFHLLMCSLILFQICNAYFVSDDIKSCDLRKKCVPKCCPKDQNIIGIYNECGRSQKFKNLDFGDVPLFNRNFKYTGRYLKDELEMVPGKLLEQNFSESAYHCSYWNDIFYLTEDGILFQEKPNHWDRFYKRNSSEFCVDYHLPEEDESVPELTFFIFIKRESTPPKTDDPVITYGLLISCIFLFLVLVVYSILPELRNLCGLVLMAYVASLLGGFFVLAYMQLLQHDPDECKDLTYATYFLLLASFCWMNVMSCDIWWTFRGYAKARPIHRRGELYKFGMYCIYAFGLPFLMTIMLVTLNNIPMRHIPWFITPKIPESGCFLTGAEKFLYLYIPMLILILANWVFYLMTAFNIWRLHRATAVLDSPGACTPAAHRSHKSRFLVYLKLSVIMGINWVLEVVSSLKPDFSGWYISDIYNILIGFSIFLIFVCKRKIYRRLIKKYKQMRGKPIKSEPTSIATASSRAVSGREDIKLSSIKNNNHF